MQEKSIRHLLDENVDERRMQCVPVVIHVVIKCRCHPFHRSLFVPLPWYEEVSQGAAEIVL